MDDSPRPFCADSREGGRETVSNQPPDLIQMSILVPKRGKACKAEERQDAQPPKHATKYALRVGLESRSARSRPPDRSVPPPSAIAT
jgi:hypothetical protein